MSQIASAWLAAPATVRVMAALAPGDPHFVGGCVRDALMERATADIDIAVRSRPEETMRLARAAGLSAYPTGIDHGVVTVTADGASFEATTLRRDVATDGRRAVVAFAETLVEDAQRRDFTMNALYADAKGYVKDPTGEGLGDLHARRIRFIGDADRRIEEDYLRILRFFRFHAQFENARFDDEALAACIRHASGLARISGERILAEMRKLLGAADPEATLQRMDDVLAVAMPGAAWLYGLVECEARHSVERSTLRRFAALGGYEDLPLSRADRRALDRIAQARTQLSGFAPAPGAPQIAAAAYQFGADEVRDALIILATEDVPLPANWKTEVARGGAAKFPVVAQDLIDRGVAPGPALGDQLRALEADWLATDMRLNADDLLAGLA